MMYDNGLMQDRAFLQDRAFMQVGTVRFFTNVLPVTVHVHPCTVNTVLLCTLLAIRYHTALIGVGEVCWIHLLSRSQNHKTYFGTHLQTNIKQSHVWRPPVSPPEEVGIYPKTRNVPNFCNLILRIWNMDSQKEDIIFSFKRFLENSNISIIKMQLIPCFWNNNLGIFIVFRNIHSF